MYRSEGDAGSATGMGIDGGAVDEAATAAERFGPIELGPDSLLWRYSDRRMGFTGLGGGLIQLMHPGLGAGVTGHSDFFNDPWDRVIRSIPQINAVVFLARPEAEVAGRKVRNYHRRIKGVDELGRPYDALDPETYWWAHATFQQMVFQVADRFSHHTLTPEEREQLYREGIEWYRRYDVTMDPVPPTNAAFVSKFSAVCTNVLEMTPAAERLIYLGQHRATEDLPGWPAWTNPLQRHLLTPIIRLTVFGSVPRIVRERFDLPWSLQNQIEYDLLCRFVRRTWALLPEQARLSPEGAAGVARVRAEAAELAAAATMAEADEVAAAASADAG